MQTFAEIIDKIKKIKGLNHDYEVAELLGISIKAFSANKKRNSLPFVELTTFCGIENISLSWLIADRGYMKLNNEKAQNSTINDSVAQYGSDALFSSDQKINIDEAMGKAYKVLNAGTALSVALYMNIQQFAAALDTGQELKECKDMINSMQQQIDALNQKVDRLSAAPSGAEGQGDGSAKKAM